MTLCLNYRKRKGIWVGCLVLLPQVMDIHGLGTKGHHAESRWVTEYTIYISEDGRNYQPLLNHITGQPRVSVVFCRHCHRRHAKQYGVMRTWRTFLNITHVPERWEPCRGRISDATSYVTLAFSTWAALVLLAAEVASMPAFCLFILHVSI